MQVTDTCKKFAATNAQRFAITLCYLRVILPLHAPWIQVISN